VGVKKNATPTTKRLLMTKGKTLKHSEFKSHDFRGIEVAFEEGGEKVHTLEEGLLC